MSVPPTLVWFRRDLRLADNPALSSAFADGERAAAAAAAPNTVRAVAESVIPVYLDDWEGGSSWAPGAASRWWLERSLLELTQALGERGLAVRRESGDPATVLPRLARETGAARVVWNRVYEPYALDLDRRVSEALEGARVEWESFSAALLFEPQDHLSSSGKAFVQFGAFWRSCMALPEPRGVVPVPEGLLRQPLAAATRGASGAGQGTEEGDAPLYASVWEPGERGARRRLKRFLEEALVDYETARDFPAEEGVSRLSPHLHFGEMSPHHIWHAVRRVVSPGTGGGGTGSGAASRARGAAVPADRGAAFLRQLGWREFAHYLLYHFPYTTTEPFRKEFARFPWHDDPDGRVAWEKGRTGFPLVDAGMRQLLAEGWMHNRVRMVVASFLTKDLLVPWQQGAAWFWDHLVDADLANNTLGWQWTAGSGPDAAPYFRIYNPALQAQRFDPDGVYRERWLGFMSETDAPEDYPDEMVDHREARLEALAAYKGLRDR